uniref:Uncharacterized protein n=1 Tax=Panagrolaimus sp. ES5 TaxID=591445 RepID=A0AC34F706_9BILA
MNRTFRHHNFTFHKEKVRAAILSPFGTQNINNGQLEPDFEEITNKLSTFKHFLTQQYFCAKKQTTIQSAFEEIDEMLKIKEHFSAALILFSDSTDETDIHVASKYRYSHFDRRNFLIIPIHLPGGKV